MIQTQLNVAPLPAIPADGALPPSLLVGGEDKAAFADAMARAQRVGQEPSASQGGDDTQLAITPDAKSLASAEAAGSQETTTKTPQEEGEMPPDEFLQQLQASLRQDVSLVVPPALPISQGEVTVAVDGNDLPPESLSLTGGSKPAPTADAAGRDAGAQQALPLTGGSKPAPTAGAAGREAAAQQALPLTGGSKPASAAGAAGREAAAQQVPSQPLGVGSQTKESSEAHKANGTEELGKVAQAMGAPAKSMGEGRQTQASSDQHKVNGTEEPGKGQAMGGPAPSASPQPTSQSEDDAVADKSVDPTQGGSKPTQPPLSGEARAALLAKVVADAPAAEPQGAAAQVTDKSQQQMAPASAANGAGAQASPAVQAGAAKAFGEGLIKVETGVNGGNPEANTAAATEDGSQPAAAQEPESKPAQAAGATKPDAGAGATGSGAPLARAADPDPVLAAPQQALARHESQGPQASLTALSAGIQQMEAEPAVAVRAAADLKPAAQKSKLDELGKPLEVSGSEPSEGSLPLQQTQSSDGKPAAEVTARREAQSLPHLKLATPEAPAQLHQKVNLMLADKLQQAEIQLDPLGLGKMKIQIQMGADSQANVHFVVQHGQTREMLEQAMPRLRDMLAGQGIQLGQTQVQQQSQQQAQQQSQQQSQGQSAFTGQEQRGQQGSGSFAGNGQGEGEHATRTLSLLVESTNDAGIDFYA